MNDTSTILRSQCDALRGLPPEAFKAAVLAIWDYEMDGKEVSDDPVAVMALGMCKPLIDKRNKLREAGKKGGRPKTISKPFNNLSETFSKPFDNHSETFSNLKIKDKNIKDKNKKNKNNISVFPDGNKSDDDIPFKSIIEYLNQKAGTAFTDKSKDTKTHIRARFNDGYKEHDFYKVIDNKVEEWKGTDMSKYLRPATLFGTKFEAYLNQQTPTKTVESPKQYSSFQNFTPSGMDWDAAFDQILYNQ